VTYAKESEVVRSLSMLQMKISQLERDIGAISYAQSTQSEASDLHQAKANLSDIRWMFVLEILRQKGLLVGVDIASIAQMARSQCAGDNAPLGVSAKDADRNVEGVFRELDGDSHWGQN